MAILILMICAVQPEVRVTQLALLIKDYPPSTLLALPTQMDPPLHRNPATRTDPSSTLQCTLTDPLPDCN